MPACRRAARSRSQSAAPPFTAPEPRSDAVWRGARRLTESFFVQPWQALREGQLRATGSVTWGSMLIILLAVVLQGFALGGALAILGFVVLGLGLLCIVVSLSAASISGTGRRRRR